jgi:hypothetical protein
MFSSNFNSVGKKVPFVPKVGALEHQKGNIFEGS